MHQNYSYVTIDISRFSLLFLNARKAMTKSADERWFTESLWMLKSGNRVSSKQSLLSR